MNALREDAKPVRTTLERAMDAAYDALAANDLLTDLMNSDSLTDVDSAVLSGRRAGGVKYLGERLTEHLTAILDALEEQDRMRAAANCIGAEPVQP